MPRRNWLRSVAWSSLAAAGLAGCTSGVGRTALRDPATPVGPSPALPSREFASLTPNVKSPLLAAQPEGAVRVQPAVRERVAAESGAARVADPAPIASSTDPAATIQLVQHDEPQAFPAFLAGDDTRSPMSPGPIQTAGNETPAGAEAITDAASTDAPAPLAPATMEPAAPLAPADGTYQYPLDLSTALALVTGQNPEVGFAQWRIQEAYARLDQAQVLWLPTIQAGLNYGRHDGNLQNIEGHIRDVNRSSLNAGLGAGAVAAGTTTVPGISAQFHSVDAVFQPRIAERTAWARQHAADAVLQDRMLDAALAYLELLESAQNIAIAQEIVADTANLAHITDQFARTGQGLLSDADRLQTELALRRNEAIRADERFAVASARLAEVLSLDANYRLTPCEVTVVPIDLVALESCRADLVASGLSYRPELKEARCLVDEACQRLKREKFAPLMPSVLLGMSYGGFGGGTGGTVARFNDRADFDALAYWQVRNLGFGERAQREAAGALIEQAKFTQIRLMDRIAREVVEAHTQVQHRRQQIDVAQAAVEAAQQSYERNLARIREGQGLPIEALQSIQALALARREYLSAVMDYNESQFRLQRALGWRCPELG
jgi:outer membrane protein TolC